jgi:fluoroquinolone transport system permease protein
MRVNALLQLDMKNISRDFILFILLPVPLFLALLLRFGFPALSVFVSEWIYLNNYNSLILMFLIIMGPLLTGMATGLMIVDENDENIVPAISVTPLGRSRYLIYRLLSPFVWSFVILLPVPVLSGLSGINYFLYVPVILTASLGAPLEAIIIAVSAGNKIEAMAVGKVTGILFIAPFISWFAPLPWKFIGSFLPGFWTAESYFSIVKDSGPWPLYIAVGLMVNIAYITILLRKYNLRAD